MSYEICVLQPVYAADREAANTAWNDQNYWDTSLPDNDPSAAKWRTKDLLMAFDGSLRWAAPAAPKTGLFAKWFSKPPALQRCLHVYRGEDDDEMSFDIFDQAIEITLPWDSPRTDAAKHVRAVWRYLEYLSASGWSTIYDTERDVLLILETDMEAVTARYIENLDPDEAESGGQSNADSVPPKPSAVPQKRDKPFTGNVD